MQQLRGTPYRLRWAVLAVAAIGLFFVALSSDVYNATSPPWLSWHVLLRKSYSIVAFAVVGGAFVWASGAPLRVAALTVAIYSCAIEIAQYYFDHSQEGLGWNAIDVACGGAGGALGALIPGLRAK